MLPIENITDDKYRVDGPYRVYYVPEGKGLEAYTREELRSPIDFDANNKPLVYLQLAKNPSTRKFVPYAIFYDAEAYTDEDILSIPTLANIGQTCSYCQSRNKVADALGLNESEAQDVEEPATSTAITPYDRVSRTIQQDIQRPIERQSNDQYMDLGKVITPSLIPAAVDVFSKVFCLPFGEALVKIGMAGLASIAAGWAAEGGTQSAWRQISEDIIRDYKICPTDIPKIQQNIVAMKDALMKDKQNIVGALSAGSLKSFSSVAKEHGFEVAAEVKARGSVSVAPFQRGPGRAID
ncbi:MAG: hypothetical protein PHP89_05375 [Candidatus Omnitrophica bacterium]|nr:hypothetical protein [Candidatus Omnitrophota bacterium]